MSALVDVVIFNPVGAGASDFVVSAARLGYLTPAAAGAVNGATYSYRAESADLAQWEVGRGVWNAGSDTLTRAVVLYNSLGNTAKINFTLVPQVGLVALATDVAVLDRANIFNDAIVLNSTLNVVGISNLRGSVAIGANLAPDTYLTINANTVAGSAPPQQGIHLIAADNTPVSLVIDNIGTGAGVGLITRRAKGSLSGGRTAVVASDNLMINNAQGWDGVTYQTGMQFRARAAETWNNATTTFGGYVEVLTASLGPASVLAAGTRFQPSGALSVGTTAIATDPGVGCVSVSNNLLVGATNGGGAFTGTVQGIQVNHSGQPMLVMRSTSGTATRQMARLVYDSSVLTTGAWVFQTLSDAGVFASNDNVLWNGGGISIGSLLYSGAGGLLIGGTAASSSTTTGALIVAGGAGIAGALNLGGSIVTPGNIIGGTFLTNGNGVSSGDAVIQLGGARSGSGNAYMDFYSAVSGGYNARIIRGGGVNGGMNIQQAGTGALAIYTEGAGNLTLGTNSTTRVTVDGSNAIFTTSILSASPTIGIGYATGAGSTGTQATSKSTTVVPTKNCNCGQITMNAAALAAATIVSFSVTDTSVAATDTIVINHISGGTLGAYTVNARAAAGSFTVDVRNNTAGSLSEALVLQFAVVKSVNA